MVVFGLYNYNLRMKKITTKTNKKDRKLNVDL